jgi:hypothetical protein
MVTKENKPEFFDCKAKDCPVMLTTKQFDYCIACANKIAKAMSTLHVAVSEIVSIDECPTNDNWNKVRNVLAVLCYEIDDLCYPEEKKEKEIAQ